MSSKQRRKQIQAAKKNIIKLARAGNKELTQQPPNYQSALKQWSKLFHCCVQARDTEAFNHHIHSVLTKINAHCDSVGFNDTVVKFCCDYFEMVINILHEYNGKQIHLRHEKYMQLDCNPILSNILNKYADYLMLCGYRYLNQKNTTLACKNLLSAIMQFDKHIKICQLMRKAIKANTTPAEITMAHMQQVISYTIIIRACLAQDQKCDNRFFITKASTLYKLCADVENTHITFANKQLLMKNLFAIYCTNPKQDDYYQLKTNAIVSLLTNVTAGQQEFQHIKFSQITELALATLAEIGRCMIQNGMANQIMAKLDANRLTLKQCVFQLQLEQFDQQKLQLEYKTIVELATKIDEPVSTLTTAMYHYTLATLHLRNTHIDAALSALSTSCDYTTQSPNDYFNNLRIGTLLASALITDSNYKILPDILTRIQQHWDNLIASSEPMSHITSLYLKYHEVLSAALLFFRHMQELSDDIEQQLHYLRQAIQIHGQLSQLYKRLHFVALGDNSAEHKRHGDAMCREMNELVKHRPPQPNLNNNNEQQHANNTEPDLSTMDARTIVKHAQALLACRQYGKAEHALTVNKTWQDTEPDMLTQAYCLLGHIRFNLAIEQGGLCNCHVKMNAALDAYGAALSCGIANDLTELTDQLGQYLYDAKQYLQATAWHIQQRLRLLQPTIPKPLHELSELAIYKLMHKGLQQFRLDYKSLIHKCDKLLFSLDVINYERAATRGADYQLPAYYQRYAKGLQIGFNRELRRANSVGSFDGVAVVRDNNPRIYK